jgi:hypothetical protein
VTWVFRSKLQEGAVVATRRARSWRTWVQLMKFVTAGGRVRSRCRSPSMDGPDAFTR